MQKINTITECWKDIPGYDGKYQASDLGNVRSLSYLGKTGDVKVMRTTLSKGYYVVGLYKNGKPKPFLVHRLIFATFNGPIPPGMTVDHVNGDKLDNRPENLQLLTRGDNARKSNKGRKLSAEHRAKLKGRTAWNKGKPAWNKGIPRTPEEKAKMSAAAKARYQRERKKLGE